MKEKDKGRAVVNVKFRFRIKKPRLSEMLKMYLKYSRGRGNRRVRGLNAAGRVNGESGLDELPLEIVGGVGGGLDVTGMLFGCPFAAGVAYDKCEDSHGYSERNPNSKLKTRREQSCSDGTLCGRNRLCTSEVLEP